jgi:hypothetical protein
MTINAFAAIWKSEGCMAAAAAEGEETTAAEEYLIDYGCRLE